MGDRERKVPFVFLAGVRRVRLEPRCVGASQRASLPRELALPFWETYYWLFSLGFSVRFPHNFCSADKSVLFAQGFVLF